MQERRCLDCNRLFTDSKRPKATQCVHCRKAFGQKDLPPSLFRDEPHVVEQYREAGMLVKRLAPAVALGALVPQPIPLRTVHPIHIPY